MLLLELLKQLTSTVLLTNFSRCKFFVDIFSSGFLPHVVHPSVSPVVCFEGIFCREQEAFPMPYG
jgi:hypothetical protein